MLLVTVAAGLYRLSVLMERKTSGFRYRDFYRQEENFDVLFIGTVMYLMTLLWNCGTIMGVFLIISAVREIR